MTRVDFYILERGEAAPIACRLAEKAYQQGYRIYMHVENAAEAARLDALLWTFRAGSFLPHAPLGEDVQAPIHIGYGEAPGDHEELLINLSPEVPLFFSRFSRVAELVPPDEAAKQAGRERWAFYRDRGYPLESHTLAGGGEA